MSSGRYPYDRSLTVGQWLPQWLERRIHDGLRPSMTVMHRRHVERDLVPALGHLRLNELCHHHLDRFLQDQLTSGRGAVTVRRIHAVLLSALASAHRLDLVEANAASNIALPPERPSCGRYKEPAQVGLFLEVAGADRLAPLFEVAVLTRLRRGDLLGLQWPDVDLVTGELMVRRQRVGADGRTVEGDEKTSAGQNRRVGLGPAAVAASTASREAQNADRRAWGNQWCGADSVFTRRDGSRSPCKFVTKRFELLVQRAKLPPTTFHGFRHQHASLLIAQGVDLAVVSKRLGHSSIAIMNDLYSHLLGDANGQAGEAAEALVPRGPMPTRSATVHSSHARRSERPKKQEAPAEDLLS